MTAEQRRKSCSFFRVYTHAQAHAAGGTLHVLRSRRYPGDQFLDPISRYPSRVSIEMEQEEGG